MRLAESQKERKLAQKGVKRRKAAQSESAQDKTEGGDRHPAGEPSQPGDPPFPAGRIHDRTDAQEEQSLDQGVIDHVKEAAVNPEMGAKSQSDEEVADLADARKGEHPLEIVLNQRHDDAGQHAHRGEQGDEGGDPA